MTQIYWTDGAYRRWNLVGDWSLLGVLEQGPRKRPGWFVYPPYRSVALVRMNPNLTLDEAQDAAKLLLLTRSAA